MQIFGFQQERVSPQQSNNSAQMLNGPIAQLVMQPTDVWQTTRFTSFSRQSRVEVNLQSDLEEMLQKLEGTPVISDKTSQIGIDRQRRRRRKFLELSVPSGILATLCLIFGIICLVNVGQIISLSLQTAKVFDDIRRLDPVLDSLIEELRVKTNARFNIRQNGTTLTEAYQHTDRQMNDILQPKTFQMWQLVSRLSDFRKDLPVDSENGDVFQSVITDSLFYSSYIQAIQDVGYKRIYKQEAFIHWKNVYRYLDTTGRLTRIELLKILLNVQKHEQNTFASFRMFDENNGMAWVYYSSKMATHRRFQFYYSDDNRLRDLTQSLHLIALLEHPSLSTMPTTNTTETVTVTVPASTEARTFLVASTSSPSLAHAQSTSQSERNISSDNTTVISVDTANLTENVTSVMIESNYTTEIPAVTNSTDDNGVSTFKRGNISTTETPESDNESNITFPQDNNTLTEWGNESDQNDKDDTKEVQKFDFRKHLGQLHKNLSSEAKHTLDFLVSSNQDLLRESILLFCVVLMALGLGVVSVIPFVMLLKHQCQLVICVAEWLDLVSADLDCQRQDTHEVFRQLVPRTIIRKLSEEQLKSRKMMPYVMNEATFLMVSIANFSHLFQLFTTSQTLQILTLVMQLLEERMQEYNVLPVALVGNSLIVVSDTLPNRKPQHAFTIANLSLDIMSCCSDLEIGRHSVSKLQMKVGVHSGPCVGMINIRNGSVQFTVTGNSIKVLRKVHKTALPNIIQVSDITERLLVQCESYSLNKRGIINVRDVGKHEIYCLNGRRVSSATFGPDSGSSQIGSWIEFERKPLYKLDEDEGSYEPLNKSKGRQPSQQRDEPFQQYSHVSPYSSS